MSRTDFVNRVRALLIKEQMLSHGDSVLIGLSGGADSVALLRVLLELREEYGIRISCAHINHGLRGKNAQRDMKFTEDLCKQLEIPIVVLQSDVEAYAKEHHLSLEDAGRQVRYAFFNEQKSDKIAVAHTKDDNAETVLMNLLKGNLPLGIAPCRGKIIRPLLGVTKEEIYAYLEEFGQDYVTDETNFTTDFTRNKVRLELIPYLEENFNTNFTNTVYHSADVLYREQLFLEELTDPVYQQASVRETNCIKLLVRELLDADEVIAKRVIRRAYYEICPKGERISYEQIDRVYRLISEVKKGKQISLPGGIVGLYSGELLIISQAQKEGFEPSFLKKDHFVFNPVLSYQIGLCKSKIADAKLCYPIRVKEGEQVTVRSRNDGDKLYFHNLKIHKKLSDFLIDKKIPLHERERIPLICVNNSVKVVVGHFYEDVTDCPEEELYYIILK